MTLFKSISVLKQISCVIGVFPIHTKIRLARLIAIMHVFLFSACIASVIVQKTTDFGEIVSGNYYNSNVVSSYGLVFHLVSGSTVLYTIYICSYLKTEDVTKTLHLIHKVDESLKKFGQKFQHRRDKIFTIVIYTAGIVTIALIISLQATNIHRENLKPMSPNTWYLLIFPLVVSNLLTCQFSFTVLAIYDRFKRVNQQLKKIEHFEEKHFHYVINRIDVLLRLHDTLCTAAKETNRNYVAQLLVTLANQYGIALFCIFYCYWMVLAKY